MLYKTQVRTRHHNQQLRNVSIAGATTLTPDGKENNESRKKETEVVLLRLVPTGQNENLDLSIHRRSDKKRVLSNPIQF